MTLPSQHRTDHHVAQAEEALGGGDASGVLPAAKLRELMEAVGEQVDPAVEVAVMQMADEFVHSVAASACALAKHRGSSTLEAKDVQYHLDKAWGIRVPGFGSQEDTTPIQRAEGVESHQSRISLVRRTISASSTKAEIKRRQQ